MHARLPDRPRPMAAAALAAALLLGGPGCINVGSSGRRAKPVKIDEKAFSGGWKDTLIDVAGGVTLATKGGVLFHAYDTLAYPGKDVELVAEFKNVRKVSGIEGLTVDFALGGKTLGRAVTDASGQATLTWTPPKAGDYDVAVTVTASEDDAYDALTKLEAAPLLVSARGKDTTFVVIDLDHTVVASGFFRVLVGGAKPMPGAAEVIKELRRRYSVIYLTHRPALLTVKSKGWLIGNGFPRAPLLVAALRDLPSSGKFKTAKIEALRKQYPNVALGIGDKLSDSEAYVANGLRAYLIPHYDRDDAKDCRKMAAAIRRLHKDVQVVDSWAEVREGVFRGKAFPTTSYAARLEARARQLDADDKDDDDDEEDDD